MKKLIVVAALALATAPAAGAFPTQPGEQAEKRVTGCMNAFENAILGQGGANANPRGLEQGTEAFVGLCPPTAP